MDLPHCQPMLELGRLLTLTGIYAQIEGDWEKAASLMFEGMRMGRQMTGQPTLAEVVRGRPDSGKQLLRTGLLGIKVSRYQTGASRLSKV